MSSVKKTFFRGAKGCIASLLLFLVPLMTMAQFKSAPAFPGAEGYGRYTTGGRGGTVYHVTTLQDYCDNTDYSPTKTKDSDIKGSLRYAVKQSGARIIVFDVAGTIELKAPLKIQNDDITILGQTAPGDGICLKNFTVSIFANNVIIRYIRCRLGNDGRRYYSSGTALSGSDQIVEDDAMNAYQKTGSEKKNIIIDHCSISWSVDECGSFYGNQDFTMQWCMLTESLRNAGHTKGNHGYGGIWGGERASFHHNMLANHDSRNPRFDHGYVSTLAGPVDYTNNVLYNWGSNSAYGGENLPGQSSKKFNMINNYYRYGNATSDKDRLLNPTTYCTNCSSAGTDVVPGTFYISGNYMYGSSTVTSDNTCSSAILMDSKGKSYSDWKSGYLSNTKFKATTQDFSSYNTISQHTAEKSYNKVLQYAGASYKRDAVDTRVCNDAKNGTTSYTTSTGKGTNGATGGFIDQPSDVGGYPTLTGTKATDTDGDGIPDAWEDANGLDKNSAADALTYTLDPKGYYQNIEVYANSLVESLVKAQRADATETFEEYYPSLASNGGGTGGNTGGSTDTPTGTTSVVYSWQMSGTDAPATDGTVGNSTNGTITFKTSDAVKTWSVESAAYNASVTDNDLKAANDKGVKGAGNANYIVVTLNSGTFQAGDAITICGYNGWKISSTSSQTGDIASTLSTGTAKTDYNIGTVTIPENISTNTLYLTRAQSSGTAITGIKVTRVIPDTPSRDTSYDKTLSGNTYTVADGDKAVSGTQIKGTSITMTYGDDTWKDAASESTKPSGYDYYITGSANPSPTNGGVPTAGCYYKFEPTAAGTLNIAMLVNASKAIYVVENGTSIGYSIDGTAYSAGSSLAAKTGGILSFAVTSGKTYYVYCSGSKLGIFGWTLTTGSGSGSGSSGAGSTVTGTETTPTAKTSNEDQVGLCYTVPATYVGGQGNSSKAIKFNLKNDKIEINVNPNYTITGFTFTGNDNYATDGITISSVTVDGGSTNVLGGSTTFAASQAENSFTVSGINATQKITLTASTPHDSQLNGTIVFTYKYKVQTLALQSTAKTTSRNGSVTLTFNNPMASGTATLNGQTITADADGTSLKFVYTGLDFGKSYTFAVSAGVLKDEYGQAYSEPVSITLATDARATVTKKAFDKVVGNGTELAAAIAAANSRSDKTTRYRIFVKKGAHVLPTSGTTTGGDNNTYPDPRTHLSGANVSIIGEDYSTTSFTNITPDATWNNGYGTACPLEGIGSGDVLIIDKTATESYFQGITIRTSMGDAHGRDIAVNDQSNKTIMKDCRLWGYQDTYVSNNSNGRFYFDGGVLRGRTDYLCGKGDVYYNKVTLQQVGTGGYAAVPSLPMKYGYIFNECYIKNETSGVTYYLGRPWGKGTPIALFINTKVDTAPIAAGWDEMNGGWPDRFAEYNTKTTSGSSVSTSSRKTTFNSSYTNKPVLTAAEATYYSNMARIMGGSDGWDPTVHTEQCAKPTATLSGSTLSWTNDSYASSWIVFKDGSYYANPVTNSLSLTEEGTYTVRAANNMGGLGEASAAVEYKDLTGGGATLAFTAAIQGGSNAAGSTVNQETHYYNNWGTTAWAAQAYIGFDVTVPAGKKIATATLKFTSKCGGNYDGRTVDVYLLPKANTVAFNTSSMTLSDALGTKVSTETDNRTASTKTVTLAADAITALNELSAADATSRVIFQLGGAAAGAYLSGYTSTDKPTLTLTFADGAYAHTHTYTYTDNGDGTHTKRCSSCGDVVENESHAGECAGCNTYWLVDGTTYTNAETKQYGKVTYTRTFSESNKGNWNALCVPFAINVADYGDQFDIAEIFAFCPYKDTNNDGSVTAEDDDMLIIFKKNSGYTSPGKPYLIRPKEAKAYSIEAADSKLYAANASYVECATTKNIFKISGLFSSVTASPENKYYYVTSTGSISHRETSSATIKPNRWYMTVTANDNYFVAGTSSAKFSYGIVVIGEDLNEPTAVRLVENNLHNDNDSSIYTLQGIKVIGKKLAPGAYIKNGRKFIIK